MADTPAPDDYAQALRRRGFRLGRLLGRGGFGSVFCARQESLNRDVAVKFFDSPFMRSADYRKRFLRESLLLARVEHPAVPYVLTQGEVRTGGETTPYFVMQHIPGASLRELLDQQRAIDPEQAYGVVDRVLSALEFAHERGVIHRDVSPKNILVGEHGACLVDFSIGFAVRHDPGLTRATRVGQGVGTPSYAAPEQLADASDVDHRVDIYSVGIVLAEILGARLPLRPDEMDAELPDVGSSVRDIIRKAVSRARENRYQTAKGFRDALRDSLGSAEQGLLDERMVLCPKPGCPGGVWSKHGAGSYFWGPKVVRSGDRYCEHCGSEYTRACTRCRRPLPENVAALVSKSSKADPDALEAHCVRCGTLIFRTPTCGRCNSYLSGNDLKTGAPDGCSRPSCQRGGGGQDDFDDIPF